MVKTRTRAIFALAVAASAMGCSAILGLKDVSIDDRPTDAKAPDGTSGDASKDAASDGFVPPSDSADTKDACNADTQNDPKNCGYCGHDCLGGTCTAGQCSAMMIFSSPSYGKGDLAVDQNAVYFTSFADVFSVDKGGGSFTTLAQSNDTFFWGATDIALSATDMYITVAQTTQYLNDGGTISYKGHFVSCPLTGCGPNHAKATDLYSGSSPYIVGFADSKGIFFSDYNAPIRRCNYPYCAGGAIPQNSANLVLGLATDGTNMYFTDWYGSSVRSCPLSGCGSGPTTLASVTGPLGISVNSADVFVASQVNNEIEKIPKGGGGAAQFATGQMRATRVVADDAWVYWTTLGNVDNMGHSTDGSVMRCPVAGCDNGTPETIGKTYDSPTGLAQDSTAVYWTTGDGKYGMQLWKVAK